MEVVELSASSGDAIIISQALNITEAARSSETTLRLMGAVAIRVHCRTHEELLIDLDRHLSDIDFMCYSREESRVARLMSKLGYERKRFLSMGTERHIYEEREEGSAVDVFFDELRMCHTINFRNRLAIDYPTISLADLLLEKLQIVQIGEKDLKDMAVLLREHDVGEQGRETVDAKYTSALLSKDWGFYYTVTSNLKKLAAFVEGNPSIPRDDALNVTTKINKLIEAFEGETKSMQWKMRARIGTKRKWYTDVENVLR